jgi:two-component system cell cycle sensor histidine kinase PleC
MSHELRTPLNAIIGFSDLVRSDLHRDGIGPRYRGYVEDIHSSGLHLLALINDILDLSKVEAGKMEPNIENLGANELVPLCLKLVEGIAGSRNVRLESKIPAEPVPIRADRRMAKQILVNLLSNAIKFSPNGKAVTLRLLQDAKGALVEVADEGIGMSEADMAIALEPFGQAHGELSRQQIGTGLGLPLAKSLTELHGGWLRIESQPAKGTICRVFFPAGAA